MVEGISRGGALAQAAIEAAMRARADALQRIAEHTGAAKSGAAAAVPATDAGEAVGRALTEGLRRVDEQVRSVDELPLELLSGRVAEFHEIAGRIKSAEIAFKFSLEVRNKLIDAYRETMRMSV
jgi:flagellar hook-basal body complex protein FliE